MTKTEYIEAKRGLAAEHNQKIEDYQEELLAHKKEYQQQVREYQRRIKLMKEEYAAKKQFLKNDFTGNHEKETKIKEKFLSPDEIKALREKKNLPFYLRSEEIFNMVTHIVGGGLSIIGMVLSIIFSVLLRPGDGIALMSMIIFGVTSITLYSVSSIYHGLRINRGKIVFQIIDHCTIYVLIAGTYVPVTLLGLSAHQPYNYIILGVVITLAVLGVVLNATMMRKVIVKVISMILYIAVGWGIIFFYPWLIEGPMGIMGTWLLILGGVTYTIGSILYGIGSKKRYWHSIFHMFVVGGTIFQFLSVFLYCICGL
jgi:hemolysin III